MQKDFHFYVTYALARKAGYTAGKAAVIAWANEYTDMQTNEDIYEIQTQCPKIDRWEDPQIQLTVLVPFHFMPGDDEQWPWKTTQNSSRAQELLREAEESGSLCRLGVALHMLQDTFSHQGFSGWWEKRNSCYPWYYLRSGIPNIGHAEMLAVPDMVDQIWYDPRDEERRPIDNRIRALEAAKVTFESLLRARGSAWDESLWNSLAAALTPIFELAKYDQRKTELRIFSGNPRIDYNKTNDRIGKANMPAFVNGASAHLSAAINTFEGLPRITPKKEEG